MEKFCTWSHVQYLSGPSLAKLTQFGIGLYSYFKFQRLNILTELFDQILQE